MCKYIFVFDVFMLCKYLYVLNIVYVFVFKYLILYYVNVFLVDDCSV